MLYMIEKLRLRMKTSADTENLKKENNLRIGQSVVFVGAIHKWMLHRSVYPQICK